MMLAIVQKQTRNICVDEIGAVSAVYQQLVGGRVTNSLQGRAFLRPQDWAGVLPSAEDAETQDEDGRCRFLQGWFNNCIAILLVVYSDKQVHLYPQIQQNSLAIET